MKTAEEIRTENLKRLIQLHGGSGKFAEIIGKDPVQISQWARNAPDSKMKRPRVISSDSCRHIERVLNLEIGWMDHDHELSDPQINIAIQLLQALPKSEKEQVIKIIATFTESSNNKKAAN